MLVLILEQHNREIKALIGKEFAKEIKGPFISIPVIGVNGYGASSKTKLARAYAFNINASLPPLIFIGLPTISPRRFTGVALV